MGRAKVALAVVGLGAGAVLILVGGAYFWSSSAANARLEEPIETHTVDIEVPWPLTDDEIAALTPEEGDPPTAEELAAVARERALARGKHLIEARYGCTVCHGADFSGGVMMDVPPLFQLYGANLTLGAGGRTADYTMADWDRSVRHGVLPRGTASAMPSEDYMLMSDQELSDIVAYIRSFPPVDAESRPRRIGPVGAMIIATGAPLSADQVADHQAAHAALAPPAEATPEFGRHLAGICTGCHNAELTGGPMTGGDPAWNDAANLTMHEDGLAAWTFEGFDTAMRRGIRPDGSPMPTPMNMVVPYTTNMTDVEMQALWAYLQSLSPKPTPQ